MESFNGRDYSFFWFLRISTIKTSAALVSLVIFLAFFFSAVAATGEAYGQTAPPVEKSTCVWADTSNPPDLTQQCVGLPQILPGIPFFYHFEITDLPSATTFTLYDDFADGFTPTVVICEAGGTTFTPATSPSLPVTSPPSQITIGPLNIATGQPINCALGGYFQIVAGQGTSGTNIVTSNVPDAASLTDQTNPTVLTQAVWPSNLAITKTASATSVALGGQVTFTIEIENQGSQGVFLGPFLRLYDQLQRTSGSMPLTATLLATPAATCTPSPCLNGAVPTQQTSPLNLAPNYQQFALWKNDPTEPVFLAGGGGTLTLTYTVEITSTATCAAAPGHGFNNKAFFDLAGQEGATISELDPNDNTTQSLHVDVTHTLDECTGGTGGTGTGTPTVTITKTQTNPTTSPVPWGTPVTYQITVTNTSPDPIELTSLSDIVSPMSPTPPFQVTGLSGTCTFGPGVTPCPPGNIPNPLNNTQQQLSMYNQSKTVWSVGSWISTSPPVLATGQTLTLDITVRYDMNSCANSAGTNWRVRNYAVLGFRFVGGINNLTFDDVMTNMEQPPLCDFLVTKDFVGGTPNPILFDDGVGPDEIYSYNVTFTNQDPNNSRTVFTVSDFVRISMQGYAQSLPISYQYNCTGSGVTPGQMQNSGFPNFSTGTAVWSGTSFTQGSPIFQLGTGGVTFGPNSTLSCTVDIKVERPNTGDPNCMGTGMATLENGAMLAAIGNYNLNQGPPSNQDYWGLAEAPLPKCYNLRVEKTVSHQVTYTSGPDSLKYNISVTNDGDDLTGLNAPDWFVLTDDFGGAYSVNTPAVVEVFNNSGLSQTNSECTGAFCIWNPPSPTGDPISFGITNLPSGWTLELTFEIPPDFAPPIVHNDVEVEQVGMEGWYSRNPETLVNLQDVAVIQETGGDEFDLMITKELVNDCVEGEGCFYEITITNNGPGIFTGPLSIVDEWYLSGVPVSGITFLMGEYPWNCTPTTATIPTNGTAVNCDGPSVTLGLDETITFHIALDVPDGLAGEVLINCLHIAWPGMDGFEDGDTNADNDHACVENIIYDCPPEYDVGIEKAAFESPWTAGDPDDGGYFEFVVTNYGDAINPSVGLVVTDTVMPAGFTITSVDADPLIWDCVFVAGPTPPASFTCTYIGGIIHEGDVLDPITVNAWGSEDGEFRNCAKVTLDGVIDVFEENNESCAEVKVDPTYDVSIVKSTVGSGDDGQWIAGEAGTFTLNIYNNGGELPAGVSLTVTDIDFPAGFDVTGAGGQYWDCSGSDFGNDTVFCIYNGPNIPEGTVLIGTITINAIAGFGEGPFENCARVDLDGYTETNMDNNISCVPVNPEPPDGFDLEVLKELIGDCKEGSVCSFAITITNNGPATFSGEIVMDDNWGLSNIDFLMGGNPWDCSGSPSSANCIGPTVTLDPNDLNNNSISLIIGLTVPDDFDEETFENCAAINWAQMPGFEDGDTNPDNDMSCIIVDPCECEDEEHNLAIWKISLGSTGMDGDWVVGESGIFVLNITNIGASIEPPEIVTVSDTMPPGFTLDTPYFVNNWWDCSSSTPTQLTCLYIGLDVVAAPPNTLMNQISFRATPSKAGEFENCASVALDGATDVAMGNNTKCIKIVVGEPTPDPRHDVMIEKIAEGSGPKGEWVPNEEGEFILQVTNLGDTIDPPGTTIVITDNDIPTWFDITINAGSDWNCTVVSAGPTYSISCEYTGDPVLTGDDFPDLVIEATAQDYGIFENCAEVELTGATDVDPSNNESCVPVVVDAPIPDPKYDIMLDKTVETMQGPAGPIYVFVLTVTNLEDPIVTPVTVNVSDILPPGFTFVPPADGGLDWNCSGLSCVYIGPTVGTGDAFHQIRITVTAPPKPGVYENCAAAELLNATDIDNSNNTDCVRIEVLDDTPDPRHDVMIEKTSAGTDGKGGWVSNMPGTFTLQVTNLGASIDPPAETIVITDDDLPIGFPISSVSGQDWNCAWPNNEVTCIYTGGPVGSGQPLPPIVITAQTRATGKLLNCAEVELTGATDVDPSNNESCVPVVVVEPTPDPRHDIAVAKTALGSSPEGGWIVGTPIQFILSVGTLGPIPQGATIVLSDVLPPEFVINSDPSSYPWQCTWPATPANNLICTYIGPPIPAGPGSLGFITLDATPREPGRFENCAKVEFDGVTDVDTSNNKSCVPVNVQDDPKGPPGLNVSIDKSSRGTDWLAASSGTYYLNVQNKGDPVQPPAEVHVEDDLPNGFVINSVTGTNWNCLFGTGTSNGLDCEYVGPPIPQGQSYPQIEVVVTTPKAGGDYRNCAIAQIEDPASSGAVDIDTSDNESCTNVTVELGEITGGGGNVGSVTVVGVFTDLTGITVVNTRPIGGIDEITVTGVDDRPIDGVDILEEDGSVTVNVPSGRPVGTIEIKGRDGTIYLDADGTRPTGPPGMTWPKDGAVNVQNGNLNETFAVPTSITNGARPAGDYEVNIGRSPVDVVAVRGGEIAVTGRGIQMQESGETGIDIAVKDGPSVSGQIPSWSYQLSAQPITRLNTWAAIYFQCSGLPNREPITIRFTPEPWQKIEPGEISLACGEAGSRIQIGQYQTSREGPQNLPAVIDRSPGR